MTVERVHVKTMWISAVVGCLAAAPMGWLAASFEMGQQIKVDSAKIAQLQKDVTSLQDGYNVFVPRVEFDTFRDTENQHWNEEHDFFVRQDSRTDEIIREHARISAMFEAARNKKP